MNREIKFKFWNPTDKEWISNAMIEIDSKNGFFHLIGEEFIVCQFTGLKDKNGKEIYEGDIVISDVYVYITDDFQGYVEKKLVVNYEFIDPYNQIPVLKFMEIYNNGDRCFYNKGRYVEVIGNIYENKELLEKIIE